MNIDDFQKQALKSAAIAKPGVAALSHRTLGLTGEAGVLANEVKKIIRDKNGEASAEDIKLIKKKLGDTLYYAAILAEYFDLLLSDVAEENLLQSEEFRKNRS